VLCTVDCNTDIQQSSNAEEQNDMISSPLSSKLDDKILDNLLLLAKRQISKNEKRMKNIPFRWGKRSSSHLSNSLNGNNKLKEFCKEFFDSVYDTNELMRDENQEHTLKGVIKYCFLILARSSNIAGEKDLSNNGVNKIPNDVLEESNFEQSMDNEYDSSKQEFHRDEKDSLLKRNNIPFRWGRK
jgi:hypothetical protein